MKDIEKVCHCEYCENYFRVIVSVDLRYADVLIRWCPLCGSEFPETIATKIKGGSQ